VGIGCGPIGPIPGGRLRGDPGSSEVVDWGVSSDAQTAQLETRPADPYSVNTWFVTLGSNLYVPTSMIRGPTEPSERSWVARVSEDPAVRIRIEGLVYERVARRVTDPDEYDRARRALETKYDLDPAQRDPERTIWIYRLDARAE
jgi:hypothetical protein